MNYDVACAIALLFLYVPYHEHSLMVFANYDVACAIALQFLYVPRENLVES